MRRAVILFLFLTFLPMESPAQIVKGSWTKLDGQPAGAAVGSIGVYTAVGILIDWRHKGHEVLYKAR